LQYWVVKSNSKIYDAVLGIGKLARGMYTGWGVSKNCRTGDRGFIGISGSKAAIIAEVELTGEPTVELGDADEPEWLGKEEARKPQYYASVRYIKFSPSGIQEPTLEGVNLTRLIGFLHRQGPVLKLMPSEVEVLQALL